MFVAPAETASFEQEVLRINARFNTEIIEGVSACPYARPARVAGSSQRRVVMASDARSALDGLMGVAADLAPREEVEVAQVIFPLIGLDAAAFQGFASDFGRANAALRPGRPVFVHAAFHPELPYSAETPSRLVPFFRRSPDPMIQLVRLAVLDAIHQAKPRGTQFFSGTAEEIAALLATRPESVTDRITRENHEAAMDGNLAHVSAIFQDILADRARSYARFVR